MKHKFAPDITRQRLLLEGYYKREVDRHAVEDYFKTITEKLALKMYGNPIIYSPEGLGKEENQGFDAFVPLIDSGISLYVWTSSKFFSVVIYTCKAFDQALALKTTKEFFNVNEVYEHSF